MIGEALAELFFQGIVVPVLRLPGALLAWGVYRGRTFKTVWLEGNEILQVLAGISIHILWIALVVIWH